MSDYKVEAFTTVKKGKVVETIYLTEEESKMFKGTNLFGPMDWKKFNRKMFRIFYRRSPAETTYEVFKPYYKEIGKEITMKDAELIRRNLIRLARKLYQIHTAQTEKIDAELEGRIR